MIKLTILVLGLTLMSFTDSTKVGIASHYALKFNGRKTATGEIYKNTNLTAASNSFKLGSIVRVTDLLNGKSVVVKINDRMHPKMARIGRIIDLSRKAAETIGSLNRLTKVTVTLL